MRIVLSDEASDDLHAIEDYIARHSGEARARAVRRRLETTMRNLAFMPGIGRARPYLKSGQRAFPVAPWTICYQLLPGDGGIEIVRVVDGRRDLPSLFE